MNCNQNLTHTTSSRKRRCDLPTPAEGDRHFAKSDHSKTNGGSKGGLNHLPIIDQGKIAERGASSSAAALSKEKKRYNHLSNSDHVLCSFHFSKDQEGENITPSQLLRVLQGVLTFWDGD